MLTSKARTDLKEAKRRLFSLQVESGAFEGTVHNSGEAAPDRNGAITALVLREVEVFADDTEWTDVIGRALDFLERCQSDSGTGMFSFWPSGGVPPWAPYNPDDCDSTSIIAAELFHFGRMTPERGRSIALELMPAFERGAGRFAAWRSDGIAPNPSDLALNVNVVAFLALTGCEDTELFRNACRAIHSDVEGCLGRIEPLDTLMPYYPEPRELTRAVHHAVRRGAKELLPVAAALAEMKFADERPVLFANEGRRTAWSSEAVSIAREINRNHCISFHSL